MLTRVDKEEEFESEVEHTCISMIGTRGIHVSKMKETGWYLIDENVSIVGHYGCAYAIGIRYCPFCGEEL